MPFADILGQKRARAVLEQALATGRVNHAYLFYGEDGVGKATAAREFAAHLLCADKTACGCCPECQKRLHGNHPGLRIFAGDASIKIDEVRDLRGPLSRTAAGTRVIIFEDADRFSQAAANAFLKTLEEPPEGAVFLLTVDVLQRLLPTVVSRCQLLRFGHLSEAQIASGLHRAHPDRSDEDIQLLARLGRGSLGRALALAAPDYLEHRRAVLDTLARLPQMAVPDVLGLSMQWNESRDQVTADLELMASWYRDLLCVQCGDCSPLNNPDYAAAIAATADLYSRPALHALLQLILSMLPTMRGNARPRFLLGYLFLQMNKGALQ